MSSKASTFSSAVLALGVAFSLPANAGALDGATSLDDASARAAALDSAAVQNMKAAQNSADLDAAAEALMVTALTAEQHELDALKSLRGVDPEVYLKYRRPDPIVGKEISEAGYHVGALLLADRYPDSFVPKRDLSDYPAWAQSKAADYGAKERAAFRTGVVVALAKSNHPAAHARVKAGIFDLTRDEILRATCATMFGGSGAKDVSKTLSDIALDAGMPSTVRSAAIVGLGKARDRAAFQTLKTLVKQNNVERRDVAIRALGNLGSKWAHESAPTADSEQLRKDATVVLIGVLPSVAGTRAAEGVAMSLATIAHPSAPQRLAALAQTNKDARARSDIRKAERLVKRALSR